MKKLAFEFILILFTIPAFTETIFFEESEDVIWRFECEYLGAEITESGIDYTINVIKTTYGENSLMQGLSGIADVNYIEEMASKRPEWQIVKEYLYKGYGYIFYKLNGVPILTFINRIDENRWLVSVVNCSKTY